MTHHKNLQSFIRELQKKGELAEISAEVDPVLEITDIYDRIVKKNGPALKFNRVKGSDMPVVINLFGSLSRMSSALGVSDIEEIAARIESFTEMKVPAGIIEKIKTIPKLGELQTLAPKIIKSAPCQQVVIRAGEGPMLDKLPVLQCWPDDGGRFITFPLVITRHPESQKRNVGLYRMHVYDNQTTGMHWQIHKDGAEHFRRLAKGSRRRMEVAVAIGTDPVTMFSAACPMPPGMDELMLAGFIRRESVELVRCKTVDLEVPAEAEIVLEGYVEEGEMRTEGPFGDHTGFYSRAKEFPVFHVTCMTHRKNPVYVTTVVGRPPMEDCHMGKAIERIFLPLIKKQLPEIVDMNLPWEGCFHNLMVVSIRKSYPDQAKKVMHAIWGLGQMMFSKCIVVLDEDANIQDAHEVAWRAFNNVDPKRDIVFVEGPVDELDHSASRDFLGSKMGIDATRKSAEEGMMRPWPEDMKMTQEVKQTVTRRWIEYGLDPKYLE
ncbi:MAG: menaquinone biosynthesis decarboxylase [Omnitrophica bacterium GWA2_52_8]|nr:MAG: menaquinone biosynthesis decarboxylase [Omnitrophica bacterium GWA2_52_8]